MLRRLIVAAFVVAGMASFAFAQFEDPIESTVTSVAATAVGTCANGTVLYDSAGVTWCGSYTTTDPSVGYINGPDCSSSPVQDATCTAANLMAAAGSDTKLITGITAATCNADGVDIITVVVCGSSATCTTNTVTQDSTPDSGTDFNCSGTDLACTQGIRDAIATLTGVSSVGCPETSGACSTTTIGVQANRSTHVIGSISTAGGCGTANIGTDGRLVFHTPLFAGSTITAGGNLVVGDDTGTKGLYLQSTAAGSGAYLCSNSGTICFSTTSTGGTFPALITSNNAYSGTQDFRGAQSNSTGDLNWNDSADLAGTLDVTASAAKGQLTTIARPATATLTCDGGGSATLVTSGLIPDGSWLIGVTARVTTALTGPTSWSIGDGTDADLYGATLAVAQGTTSSNADATANWGNPQLAANEVTVTFNGGNCTAGVLSVNAHYFTVTAPTSN